MFAVRFAGGEVALYAEDALERIAGEREANDPETVRRRNGRGAGRLAAETGGKPESARGAVVNLFA